MTKYAELRKRRFKVKKLYNKGLGYKEIAKKLDCIVFDVSNDVRALREEGKLEGLRKQYYSKVEIKERRAKVLGLRLGGMEIEDIAKKLSCSVSTVGRDLRILRKDKKIK